MLLVGYLVPFFININIHDIDILLSDKDGLYSASIRSLGFAFFSSLVNILLSLFVAVKLKSIKAHSFKGLLLSILIIPALLGDVSTSFIYKLILSDFVHLHQDSFQKLVVATVIQFWQYGTLFIYIIWLVIKGINAEYFDYCKVSYFSKYETFRDLILPACKNTVILLFVINFIFSVYEDSKMQLIFRSSRGTNTEFINQWLSRTYESASLINPITARTEIYSISLMYLFLLLGTLLVVVSLLLTTISLLVKHRKSPPIFSSFNTSYVIYYVLIASVLAPIFFIIFHIFSNFNLSFSHLIYPLYLSFTTAFIAVIIAIVIGAAIRVGGLKYMESLNRKSQFVFYLVLLLQLIPGIVISLLGYQWAAYIDLGKSNMVLLWIVGHILLILPLISCLLITNHFQISNNEINYLFTHKTSSFDFIKLSFLSRFKGDYLLTFLICVTMIWNDPILNSILSDYVPSFISEMKMSITGRAADYSKGISYFAISLIVSLGAYFLWVYNNYKKSILNETY